MRNCILIKTISIINNNIERLKIIENKLNNVIIENEFIQDLIELKNRKLDRDHK